MGKKEKVNVTRDLSQSSETTSVMELEDNTPVVERRKPSLQTGERSFELLVDGVPYVGKSVPFLFNDEMQFRVTLGDGIEHLFAWDSEINMLRFIDDESSMLPVGFEEALSDKLTE